MKPGYIAAEYWILYPKLKPNTKGKKVEKKKKNQKKKDPKPSNDSDNLDFPGDKREKALLIAVANMGVEDSLNQIDIDSQEPNAEEVFISTLRNESFINSIQDLIKRLKNKSSIKDLRKRELGSNFISDNAVTSYILSNRKDFYSYKEIDKSIYWGNAS